MGELEKEADVGDVAVSQGGIGGRRGCGRRVEAADEVGDGGFAVQGDAPELGGAEGRVEVPGDGRHGDQAWLGEGGGDPGDGGGSRRFGRRRLGRTLWRGWYVVDAVDGSGEGRLSSSYVFCEIKDELSCKETAELARDILPGLPCSSIYGGGSPATRQLAVGFAEYGKSPIDGSRQLRNGMTWVTRYQSFFLARTLIYHVRGCSVVWRFE